MKRFALTWLSHDPKKSSVVSRIKTRGMEPMEIYKMLLDSIQHKKYEINPDIYVLEVGDMVKPETIIGYKNENRQPVTAGLCGQVVKIDFDPANDTIMRLAVYKNIN